MTSRYMQDVSECEERLRLLLFDEYMQNAKNDLENQPSDVPLPRGITTWEASPGPDLGIQIEVATEEYNISVCRQIVFDRISGLPRELRDTIWGDLVPGKVDLCTKPSCPCAGVDKSVRRDKADDDDDSDYDEIMEDGDNSGEDDGSDENESSSDDSDFDRDDDDDITEERWLVHNSWSDRSWKLPSPRTDEDYICPEYYWRDDVIGPQYALELIECFYRTSLFSITSYTDPRQTVNVAGGLEFFLNNDHFGLRLLPKDWISSLVLKFHLSDYSWELLRSERGIGWHLHQNGRWWIEDQRWRDALKGLRSLTKKVRITIQLENLRDVRWNWNNIVVSLGAVAVDRVMRLLMPMLASSRRAGHGVRVKLAEKWNDEGVRSVLAKWLHRLERGTSEGDEYPSVVDCD